ncbi:Deoxyribodipyrimidine photolyase, type II [Chitinispirillum alkaliphilum]|nr:Deoxyribodipyrimidine photolyase, type II [Chitinispirillum alkaliphilum]
MIQEERIQHLNNTRPNRNGQFVLYWMQQSQRVKFNQALEYAAQSANDASVPLVVFFAVTESFPEANLRHYHFMLSGLKQTEMQLRDRGIRFVIRICKNIEECVAELAQRAVMVVTDWGYLSIQQLWRKQLVSVLNCPFVQIESDAIVPVMVASSKQEIGARTLRTKIQKNFNRFLQPLKEVSIGKDSLHLKFKSESLSDTDAFLELLKIDRTVPVVKWLKGGPEEAETVLGRFLKKKLSGFGQYRNDPSKNHLSNLSPYLHFGQISPVHVALKVSEAGSADTAAFLEEMVVRRELGFNFCMYNGNYDSFSAIPGWAAETLQKHRKDKRPRHYSLRELENAQTYDSYWNAAQREMVHLGKMHGYMRMYWGKKIIEWSPTPNEAFKRALYLNNKYSIDGRDPNSFTGVAWCFGLHDRAWGERDIFGKVRYMNSKGLERKFDMKKYVELVNKRVDRELNNGSHR